MHYFVMGKCATNLKARESNMTFEWHLSVDNVGVCLSCKQSWMGRYFKCVFIICHCHLTVNNTKPVVLLIEPKHLAPEQKEKISVNWIFNYRTAGNQICYWVTGTQALEGFDRMSTGRTNWDGRGQSRSRRFIATQLKIQWRCWYSTDSCPAMLKRTVLVTNVV